MSCDVEQEEIVERVWQEWRRKEGNKLEVSELRCLETGPVMVLFNVSNEGNLHTITAETLRPMKRAAKHKKDTDMALDGSYDDAGGEVSVSDISL